MGAAAASGDDAFDQLQRGVIRVDRIRYHKDPHASRVTFHYRNSQETGAVRLDEILTVLEKSRETGLPEVVERNIESINTFLQRREQDYARFAETGDDRIEWEELRDTVQDIDRLYEEVTAPEKLSVNVEDVDVQSFIEEHYGEE